MCSQEFQDERGSQKGHLRKYAQITGKECKKPTAKGGVASKESAGAPVKCPEEDKELS